MNIANTEGTRPSIGPLLSVRTIQSKKYYYNTICHQITRFIFLVNKVIET